MQSLVYPERANSLKQRWFSCAYCKNGLIPPDQHVGDVFSAIKGLVKPVKDWNMKLPCEIEALMNKYEHGQVSLCGLLSNTVKEAGVSKYHHVQGEVNAIAKLDHHYYGLFVCLFVFFCSER